MNSKQAKRLRRQVADRCKVKGIPLDTEYKSLAGTVRTKPRLDKSGRPMVDDQGQLITYQTSTWVLAPCQRQVYRRMKSVIAYAKSV